MFGFLEAYVVLIVGEGFAGDGFHGFEEVGSVGAEVFGEFVGVGFVGGLVVEEVVA